MSANLVASLVLKLEDQLTGGVRKLQEELEALRGVAEKVQLSGLKNSSETLDKLRTKIGQTKVAIYEMNQSVRDGGLAFASMGRMARAAMDGAWNATAGIRERFNGIKGRVDAFGEAGSNLVNKGFGAAAEGFAVLAPIQQYAERDKALRQQGVMEGLKGAALEAEIKRLGILVNADALRNAVPSDSIVEARKDLLGQGIAADKVDIALRTHTAAAKAYNIPPDLLGPVTGAMLGNMKIDPGEEALGGALAAIAKASQTGRFKMEDFSHALPGASGVAASLGMTGRKSLNELAAGFEISTRTATDPTQAGVNFVDLLNYITSNREDNLTRKKLGLDLPALLLKAQAQGTNPLDAFLGLLKTLTKGKSPLEQAQAISQIMTNQQARMSALALIQNDPEFHARQNELAGIDGSKLKTDNASMMAGEETHLSLFSENLHQLSMTLGASFAPVLNVIGVALGKINQGLTYLNTNFPTATAYVLGGLAAMLALGAVLTLIGAVVPVLVTGWGLMGSVLSTVVIGPISALWTGLRFVVFLLASLTGVSVGVVVAIGVLAAVFTAAAIDIYENWGRFRSFFVQLWTGIEDIFMGFVHVIKGILTGDLSEAFGGLKQISKGYIEAYAALFGIIKQLFMDFIHWVDGWAAGFGTRMLDGIKSGWGNLVSGFKDMLTSLTDVGNNSAMRRMQAARDRANGNTGDAGAVGAPAAVGVSGQVHVHVTTDPGVTARTVSATPGIKATTGPNRGATVARP